MKGCIRVLAMMVPHCQVYIANLLENPLQARLLDQKNIAFENIPAPCSLLLVNYITCSNRKVMIFSIK